MKVTRREPPFSRRARAAARQLRGNTEPERDEWFLAGTETARIVPVLAAAGRPRIDSPANGAIYAIDPDIPRGASASR
jgi:penicillin-binding protein 1C